MILSRFIDKQAMSTETIVKDFKTWIDQQDYCELSKEQENEIRILCKKYPILNILCAAMQEIGYDSF